MKWCRQTEWSPNIQDDDNEGFCQKEQLTLPEREEFDPARTRIVDPAWKG